MSFLFVLVVIALMCCAYGDLGSALTKLNYYKQIQGRVSQLASRRASMSSVIGVHATINVLFANCMGGECQIGSGLDYFGGF